MLRSSNFKFPLGDAAILSISTDTGGSDGIGQVKITRLYRTV